MTTKKLAFSGRIARLRGLPKSARWLPRDDPRSLAFSGYLQRQADWKSAPRREGALAPRWLRGL